MSILWFTPDVASMLRPILILVRHWPVSNCINTQIKGTVCKIQALFVMAQIAGLRTYKCLFCDVTLLVRLISRPKKEKKKVSHEKYKEKKIS